MGKKALRRLKDNKNSLTTHLGSKSWDHKMKRKTIAHYSGSKTTPIKTKLNTSTII